MKHPLLISASCFILMACAVDEDGTVSEATEEAASPTESSGVDEQTPTPTATPQVDDPVGEQEERPVGYEIMQVMSPTEIWAWASSELTPEEFEAIELPEGWFKNQPRESDADEGVFFKSPEASTDGEFTEATLFGYEWTHVATVTETNIALDDDGLLIGSQVSKFHQLSYNAGRTLSFISSPDGEHYVRVTRDAGRTSETSTMPETWQLYAHEITDDFVVRLPDQTLVIRTENQDSYQGPVTPPDLDD